MQKDFKKFAQQKSEKKPIFSFKNWWSNVFTSTLAVNSIKTYKSTSSKKFASATQPRVTLTKNDTKNGSTESKNNVFSPLLSLVLVVFAIPLQLLSFLFKTIFQPFKLFTRSRDIVIKTFSSIIFLALFLQFLNIQVLNQSNNFSGSSSNLNLIFSQRGQIFVQDISFSKKNRPLTSSLYSSKITFNPATLNSMIKNGTITETKAIKAVSTMFNLPEKDVETIIQRELGRSEIRQYSVLYENLNSSQTQTLKSLLLKGEFETKEFGKQNFVNWINVEDTEVRTYPENTFLSPSVGYMREKPAPAKEVEAVPSCQGMINKNKERGTDYIQYKLPSGGLEERFCSELAGVNGRELSNAEITDANQSLKVVDGANIYLTIDYNIQRKAEEILDQTVKNTTNERGAPKDGSIIVVEVNNPTDPTKNGRVLAMASYPRYDPNKYADEFSKNPAAFRNASTSIDFEIGSVMKPVTVATALDSYFNAVDENTKLTTKKTCPGTGEKALTLANQEPDLYDLRLCVSPFWTFNDYPNATKEFASVDGEITKVSNFTKSSYGNNLTLSNVIRDSINTGISDIMDNQSRVNIKNYFLDRFQFGKPTLADSPGDAAGNIAPFNNLIGARISNTFFGFGQGFTASPMQVVRSYMPLLNGGKMIQPYLVDRIEYADRTVDDGTDPNSRIYRGQPEQIIRKESADLVKGYMIDTSSQGFRGNGRSIDLNGYSNGSKTGTAQIDETVEVKDANGNVILNENGKPKTERRNYDYSSALGLTNHTWAGFAPAENPRVFVFIKISKPLPGNTTISSLSTLKQPYIDMLQYSLEYLGVQKDK